MDRARTRSWPALLVQVVLLLTVACDAGGRAERRGGVDAAAGGESGPATVRISGVVQLEGRDDSSGVQVFIPGSSLVAMTDAAGRFELSPVGEGLYELQARAAGFHGAKLGPVQVTPADAGRTIPLDPLVLQPETAAAEPAGAALGAIAGDVVAGDEMAGETINWAACTISLENTPYRTTCDSDGSFLLWNLPPDRYQLRATMPGFQTWTQSVRVLPGEPDERLVIELTPAGNYGGGGPGHDRRIRGVVTLTGPDGEPSNAFDQVLIEIANHPELKAILENDGTFEFPSLAPGRYVVMASGIGFEDARPVEVDLTNAPAVDVHLELRAEPGIEPAGAVIRGIARKNDNEIRDMSGIQVALAGTSHAATTNAQGEYVIDEIEPGIYDVIAQADGYEPARLGPVELAAGEEVNLEEMILEPIRDYPEVLSVSPADGTRGVLVREVVPVRVRFSKKMDLPSLRRAIQFDPPVSFEVFAGGGKAGPDTDFVQIELAGSEGDPVALLNQRYRMTIGVTAKDVEGLTLQEPFEAEFSTAGPAVIRTVPADEGLKRSLSPSEPVSVFFNTRMDPASLGSDTLRFRPRLRMAPVLSVQEDRATGWSILNIQAQWEEDTEYSITIGRRAETFDRDKLDNAPYTFRFTTPELREFEPSRAPQGVR